VFFVQTKHFQGDKNHKSFILKYLQITDFIVQEKRTDQTQKQTHYCAKNAAQPQTNPILTRSFTNPITRWNLPTDHISAG
jgi:hypothetical protein